jgi:hypothetical protein
MYSQLLDSSHNPTAASTDLLRTAAGLPQVEFGPGTYRITDPLPTWVQVSPEHVPECWTCGDTLTFVFRPRIDAHSAGTAGIYQTPVAIRCNCFLAEIGSNPLVLAYHLKLSRPPVPIEASL